MRFRDRADAGRQLAAKLSQYGGRPDVVVLALPRGGVPVAAEVASALRVPLDIFLVRTLGVPGHEELAMGARAEGGVRVVNEALVRDLAIPADAIERAVAREHAELDRRDRQYRAGRSRVDAAGRQIILIDDGLATGASMEAAILALRQFRPARIIVAVPVGAHDTCARLSRIADEIICLSTPPEFQAVGLWYDDFNQTSDDEVRTALAADVPPPAAACSSGW